MSWSPERCLDCADQGPWPGIGLLARVPLTNAGRVADLGCGPGNSTALLAGRWPEPSVIGVDGSREMLARRP
jgi:trans-aconitate 2-methyltransferase